VDPASVIDVFPLPHPHPVKARMPGTAVSNATVIAFFLFIGFPRVRLSVQGKKSDDFVLNAFRRNSRIPAGIVPLSSKKPH
jgi:hypothetical protein